MVDYALKNDTDFIRALHETYIQDADVPTHMLKSRAEMCILRFLGREFLKRTAGFARCVVDIP